MEIKALGEVRAHLAKGCDLTGRFDALRHDPGSKAPAKCQDAFDDRSLVGIAVQTVDQSKVDFQQIDNSGGTQIEAVDPAAEVIQRDQNAGLPQFVGVDDQQALFATAPVLDQFPTQRMTPFSE